MRGGGKRGFPGWQHVSCGGDRDRSGDVVEFPVRACDGARNDLIGRSRDPALCTGGVCRVFLSDSRNFSQEGILKAGRMIFKRAKRRFCFNANFTHFQ